MAETRPSGAYTLPIDNPKVIQEVAEIGIRGRFNILPRWAKRVGWIPIPPTGDVPALIVLVEPGLASIRAWEPDGPRVVARHDEVSQNEPDDGEEILRLIHDRYLQLIIPKDRRVHIGDSILQHLGLSTDRDSRTNVYVAVHSSRIDILSSNYRNERHQLGHPSLDNLP